MSGELRDPAAPDDTIRGIDGSEYGEGLRDGSMLLLYPGEGPTKEHGRVFGRRFRTQLLWMDPEPVGWRRHVEGLLKRCAARGNRARWRDGEQDVLAVQTTPPPVSPSYEQVLAACQLLKAAGFEVRHEVRVGHELRSVPGVVVSTPGDPDALVWRRIALYQPWEHPPESKVERALRADDNEEADG